MYKKKILSILLACLTVFGAFTACKNNSEDSSSSSSDNFEAIEVPEFNDTGIVPVENVKAYDPTILYPTVRFEVDKAKTFIKNGASEYKILIPANAAKKIRNAATAVKKYIKEATGVDLPIVEETDGNSYNKVISIGYTNELAKVDISLTQNDLGYLGYKIQSIEDNIYVCAFADSGTAVAVYALLHHLIGLRIYSEDEAVFETKMTEIPFYDFDLTQKAVTGYVQIHDNPNSTNAALGLGGEHFSSYTQVETGTLVDIWHNALELFPKSQYLETHPEFYIAKGTQISYVANGNRESYNLMVDIAANSIIESAKENANLKRVTITQGDNTDPDTCEAAKEIIARYGTESALQILFVNDVARKVNDWAKDPNGGNGRQIDVYFFAYQNTISAPVSMVNGVYVPNEDIYMEENVGVVLAPIDSNWSLSIYDENNSSLLAIIEKWAAISPKLALWAYHYYHNNYMMPYDVYPNLQSIYQAAREFNIEWVYDESRFAGGQTTYFTYLGTYLSGQLAYNPDLNVAQEMDKWFNYYFKDAQSYMRQYFDETRSWYQYLQDTYAVSSKVMSYDIDTPERWPYGLLMRWNSYITQAYQSIEKYKTDDVLLYEKLYDRINLESIMIRYMLATYHESKFSDTELMNFRREFANDCNHLGVLMLKHGSPMSQLFTSWGL